MSIIMIGDSTYNSYCCISDRKSLDHVAARMSLEKYRENSASFLIFVLSDDINAEYINTNTNM